MATAGIRFKIMPEGVDTNLEELKIKIKAAVESNTTSIETNRTYLKRMSVVLDKLAKQATQDAVPAAAAAPAPAEAPKEAAAPEAAKAE